MPQQKIGQYSFDDIDPPKQAGQYSQDDIDLFAPEDWSPSPRGGPLGRSEVTPLSPREEPLFQSWVQKNRITDVDQPGSHYDYRGYWKEFGDQPIQFGVDHFTDTYKQHGHPTFSEESKYSDGPGDGGTWKGETYVQPTGRDRGPTGGMREPSQSVFAQSNLVPGVRRTQDIELQAPPPIPTGTSVRIDSLDPSMTILDPSAGATIAGSEPERQRTIPYDTQRPVQAPQQPYGFAENVLGVGQQLAKAPEVFRADNVPLEAAKFAFDTFARAGEAAVRLPGAIPDPTGALGVTGAYFKGLAGGVSQGLIDPMALLAAGAYADTAEEAQLFVKPAVMARDFFAQEVMQRDPITDPWALASPTWWAANMGQLTGSMLPLVFAGAGGATTGLSLARGIAGRMATAEFLTAAASKGGLVASAVGESLLESSSVYVDKIEEGASIEEASRAAAGTFAANIALLGLTEHPLFEAAGWGKRALFEAGQEVAQTGISNVATGKPLTEGMGTAAILGGIGGPIVGGAMDRVLGGARPPELEPPQNPTARLVTPDIIDPDPEKRAAQLREMLAKGYVPAGGEDDSDMSFTYQAPAGPQGPPPTPDGTIGGTIPPGQAPADAGTIPETIQAPPPASGPPTKRFSEMTEDEKVAAVQAQLDAERGATTAPPVEAPKNSNTVTVYHGSAEIARRGTFEGFQRDISPSGSAREIGKTMDSMGTWWTTSEADARSFGQSINMEDQRGPKNEGALVTGEMTLENPKVFASPAEFEKFVQSLRTRDDIKLPDGSISPGMKAARGDAIRAALSEHDGIIIHEGGKGDARPEGGDYLLAFDDARFKVTNVAMPTQAPIAGTDESARDSREFPVRNQIGSDRLERALTPEAQQNLDQMFNDPRASKGTQETRIAMEVYERLLAPTGDDVDLDRSPGSPALAQADSLRAAVETFFTAPTPEARQEAAFTLRDEAWSGLQLVTGKEDPDLHNDVLDGEISASPHDVGDAVFETLDPATATFDAGVVNSAYSMVEWRREKKPFPKVAGHERSVNVVPKEDRPKPVREGSKELVIVPPEQRKGTYISQEAGDRQKSIWKQVAQLIGQREDNSKKVIISLFDRTGIMSQPYEDAGYTVLRYDITTGQDLTKFGDWMADVENQIGDDQEIVGIIGQPPCTTYTLSGNAWLDRRGVESREEIARTFDLDVDSFHEKFKTPLDYANTLVAVVKLIVQQANPRFYVMENPAGTIRRHNSLPESRLSFDPSAYGDPYLKQTHFWGEFSTKLPKANVYPYLGSLMHQKSGGDLTRSETPEGVAYAFFMANNDSTQLKALEAEATAMVDGQSEEAPKPKKFSEMTDEEKLAAVQAQLAAEAQPETKPEKKGPKAKGSVWTNPSVNKRPNVKREGGGSFFQGFFNNNAGERESYDIAKEDAVFQQAEDYVNEVLGKIDARAAALGAPMSSAVVANDPTYKALRFKASNVAGVASRYANQLKAVKKDYERGDPARVAETREELIKEIATHQASKPPITKPTEAAPDKGKLVPVRDDAGNVRWTTEPVTEAPVEAPAEAPAPSAADIEREKLGEKKTAAQQRRADAIAGIRKALKEGGSTLGSFNPPAGLVSATIKLVEAYAAEGITDIQIAWVNFKEDMPDLYQEAKRAFEVAFGMVHDVTNARVSEEPDGTTDQTQSDLDGPGRGPVDRGGATSPDRDGGDGALETLPADAEQAAGGEGTGRPADRDPQGVVADGVSDETDGGAQSEAPAGDGGGIVPGGAVSPTGATDSPTPVVKPQDYSLTPEGIDAIVARGDMQRARDNLAAIKLLKTIAAEGRYATPEEQETLAKYVGWGASAVSKFLNDDADYHWRDTEKALWRDIKETLTPEERKSLIRSTPNAHFSFNLYTPIWKAIEAMGFNGGRVLEPAIGVGHAIGLMPGHIRANSTIIGTDLDPVTASIATLLYPSAKVQSKGYEVARIPRNTQDIIISNVPFGAFGVRDALLPDFITDRIHNYFFAKALEHARPGGYVVFITSRYTMDGQESAQVRRYLMERAHFVGAVRLSKDVFGKSAKTEVITDVIVLQKFNQEGETARNAEAFIEAPHRPHLSTPESKEGRKKIPAKNIYRSQWYDEHPEYLLGTETTGGSMYGANEYTVESRDREDVNGRFLGDALAKILPPGSYEAATTTSTKVPDTPLEKGTYKTGEIRMDGDTVMQVTNTGEQVDITPKRMVKGKPEPHGDSVRRIKLMVGIRDALRATVETMRSKTATDAQITAAQKALKEKYDTFHQAFGELNAPLNKRLFKTDPEATNLTGLEVVDPRLSIAHGKDGKTKIKVAYQVIGLSDIFTKRTINAPIEIDKAESPTDALLASLGTRTKIDWPYMARIYSGSDSVEAQQKMQAQLAEAGHVFESQDGAWYTADEYLSGDVVTKLEDVRAMDEPERFARNIAALEKVQPKEKTAEDPIVLSLGAHWIPKQYVQQFIDSQLREDGALVSNVMTERLVRWAIAFTDDQLGKARKHDLNVSVGTRDDKGIVINEKKVYTFDELIDDALNLKTPSLGWTETSYDGKKFTVKDPVATLAARANIEEIRSQWLQWVAENTEVETALIKLYNERFNRTAKRQFDGSHLANFDEQGNRTAALPGLALSFRLYKHQLDAIWRILTSGNTLLAHEVGAGKTFEMIVAAMEMRRTGRARKPMITVPTILLQSWKRDIIKAYPQAKILAFDENDLSATKRQQAMARIAFGDWDIVLVPHSSFELLNVSDERMASVLQEWVDEMIAAENADRAANGEDSLSARKSEDHRRKLEDKIAELLESAKSADDSLTWEQLGVDALMVDEAHAFKNLYFTSKLDALRGLSRSSARKSLDMFIKVKEINEASGHRNLVLATATPIMNSLAEIYTMQRYLQPDRLNELGFANFDNWYAMFAEALPVIEQRPDNSYQEVMRLKQFKNLQLLYNTVAEVMDYIGWQDMPYLKLPKLKGGRATVVETEPHPLYPKLKKWFADRLTAIRLNPPRYDKRKKEYIAPERMHPLTGLPMGKKDNILTVMTDAKLAAIDVRLVLGDEASDYPGSRLQATAARVYDVWKAEKDKKGVSLIFMDAGTPTEKGVMEFLGDNVEIEDETEGGGIGTEEDATDEDAEYIENGNFNMYEAMKKELIRRGIPAHEIAFIHDAEQPAERLALFDAVNEGKVRVLMASTDKGGVGMNAQQRMAAMFHFDAPRYGRPGDIRQRLGRMIRQGNMYGEPGPFMADVQEFRFITKGTTDEWLYGLIAGKAHGIEQFMRGDATSMTEDDPSTISIEEAQMRASNDPRGIELMELRAQLKRMDAQAASAERAIGKAKGALAKWEQRLPAIRAELERVTAWLKQTKRRLLLKRSDPSAPLSRKGPPRTFELLVGNTKHHKQGEANTALLKALEKVNDKQSKVPVQVGEFEGLPMLAFYRIAWRDNGVVLYFDTSAAFDGGDVAITTVDRPEEGDFGEGRSLIPSIQRAFGSILDLRARNEREIKEGESELADAKVTIAKPFDVIERARKARARVQELETELKTESEQKDRTADAEAKAQKAAAERQARGEKDDDDTHGSPGEHGMPPRQKKTAPPPKPPLNAPEDLRSRQYGPPRNPDALANDIKPSTIIKALSKALGDMPVNVGGLSRAWRGIFKSFSRAIRLRHANHLRVALHEFGHDFDITVMKLMLKDKRWLKDLRALGQQTSKQYYSRKDELTEGAAEWFVLYMSDPQTAEQAAPEYYKAIETALAQDQFADLKAALDDIRQMVMQYAEASDEEQGRRSISRERPGILKRTYRYAREDPMAALRDVRVQTVESYAWLNEAVTRLRDGLPLNTAEDASVLSQISKGSGSKAEGFVSHGVRGMDGRFLSGSLEDALKPIAGRIDEWEDYMVALRIKELIVDRGRERPGMTLPQAEAIIKKTEARKDFGDFEQARDSYWKFKDAVLDYALDYGALTHDQVATMRALNKKYIPLKRVQEEVDTLFSGGGRKIANRRSPIKRIGDSNLEIIAPLEAVTSDLYAMVDFVEKNRAARAFADQVEATQGSAKWMEKWPTPMAPTGLKLNEFTKEIQQVLDTYKVQLPANMDLDAALDWMVHTWKPQQFVNGKDKLITIIRDGQREYYKVNHAGLYEALTMEGPRDATSYWRFLQKPATGATNVLRTTATSTPAFIVRNFTRDSLVALLQSRYGFIPIWDHAAAIVSMARGDADAKLFWTSGVAQATMVGNDRKARAQHIERMVNGRVGRGVKGALTGKPGVDTLEVVSGMQLVRVLYEMLQKASMTVETATRLAEFKLALDTGGQERTLLSRMTSAKAKRGALTESSIVAATKAARDVTTDFQRGGTFIKEASRYYAFLNARTQGWARLFETAARAVKAPPIDYTKQKGVHLNLRGEGADMLFKLAGLASVSALLWALNKDDDEWKEKQEWEKSSYWFIRVGDRFVRVAKPFEWGLASNIMEAALEYSYENGDNRRFDDIWHSYFPTFDLNDKNALKRSFINIFPQVAIPPLEAVFNYSSFRDAPLWNPWERGGKAAEYSRWTSEVAKVMSEYLPMTGLNPAQIDHLISGYTSNFGQLAMSGGDKVIDAVRGGDQERPSSPTPPIAQQMGMNILFAGGEYSGQSQSIQDIYQLAEAVAVIEKRTLPDGESPDSYETKLGKFTPEQVADIKAARARFSDEFADQIKEVYAAPLSEMSPHDKRVELNRIYREMVDVAREALGKRPTTR